MTLAKVICGFQSGADQAGARAAKALGIPTGGSMRDRFLTEDGPRPEFAELYGAVAIPGGSYPDRTFANARDSDGTLWIGSTTSRGYASTWGACESFTPSKPTFIVGPGTKPSEAAEWIIDNDIHVINIAGNRESVSPGIGERAERFLTAVFRRLIQGE